MSEYIEFLNEVFEAFGLIEARRMFGGYGLYHDGVMFGIVADEMLYLKADEASKGYFEEKDLSPFEYQKKGKPIQMSFFQAPEEIFDDRDAAAVWADRARQAAVRAKSPRKKPGKK